MENMILQPIVVGGQTFKNRIMFPPLTTGYEKNGMISEQDMGFYTRLAKGGVGYIVLGDVAPINSFSPTPKLFDDSQIPAFKALADSVHAYGTKLGVQLFHPEYDVDAINSLFMQKKFDEMRQRLHHDMMFFTDEVSEEMLMAIIDKMCACAVRAQKAGVDVIQIHGDRLNGCLCSTRMNHRTDKFGGSLENRLRFLDEVTRAVCAEIGAARVGVRLAPLTTLNGTVDADPETTYTAAARLLGQLDIAYLHIAEADWDDAPQMRVEFKQAIRAAFSNVLIYAGKYDAARARSAIREGWADLIGFGRPFIANPDLPERIRSGAPWAQHDPATLFGGGAHGLTDYPRLSPDPL